MNRSTFGGVIAKYLLLLLAVAALVGYFYWKGTYGRVGDVGSLTGSSAGQIAFVRQDDNGQTQLYAVKADASAEPKALTNGRGAKQSPAWSPDGTRICYVAEPDNGGNVEHTFQVFLKGQGDPQQITVGSIAKSMPQWRPDGNLITYLAGGEIKSVEPNGREREQIYPLPKKSSGQENSQSGAQSGEQAEDALKTPPVIYYRWAKNSASLALIHEFEGDIQIPGSADWFHKDRQGAGSDAPATVEPEMVFVVPAVGGTDLFPWREAAGSRVGLAWFPDSTRLAVTTSGGANKINALMSIRADDRNGQPMPIFGGVGYTIAPENPAVSPDGSQVACEVWRMNSAEDRELMGIAVAPASQNPPLAIRTPADISKLPIKITGHVQNPRWSPDGARLLYTLTGSNGRRDVWVANANGTNPINLTKGKGDNFDAVWSPALK